MPETLQERLDRIENENSEYEARVITVDLAKERVKKTMQHYFKSIYPRCGIAWDKDNTAEIDNMVDDIFDTMKKI